MKAIEINGKIKIYNNLPNSWKGVMGNFSKLSDEEIEAYGFYDVVIPEYDSRVENLDEPYFDSINKVFTQNVVDKTWAQTLEELKQQQINNFKGSVSAELQRTDWYIVRNHETNISVPEDVLTKRQDLRAKAITVENEISSLTTKKLVMSYTLPNLIS